MNMTDITDAQIKRLRELMERRDAANAAWSAAPYDPNARLHHDNCVGVLAHEAIKYLPALLDALAETAAQRDAAVKRVGASEKFARIMADAADANVSATASERRHHLNTLRIMRRIMEESASYLQTTTRKAAQMALNDGEQAGLK
jgi:hypothetical protein